MRERVGNIAFRPLGFRLELYSPIPSENDVEVSKAPLADLVARFRRRSYRFSTFTNKSSNMSTPAGLVLRRGIAKAETALCAWSLQTLSAVFGNSGGADVQLGADDFAHFVNSSSNHLLTISRSSTVSL
jgi:hypothetical protein